MKSGKQPNVAAEEQMLWHPNASSGHWNSLLQCDTKLLLQLNLSVQRGQKASFSRGNGWLLSSWAGLWLHQGWHINMLPTQSTTHETNHRNRLLMVNQSNCFVVCLLVSELQPPAKQLFLSAICKYFVIEHVSVKVSTHYHYQLYDLNLQLIFSDFSEHHLPNTSTGE